MAKGCILTYKELILESENHQSKMSNDIYNDQKCDVFAFQNHQNQLYISSGSIFIAVK